MWLNKLKRTEGYILLEALISMSILVLLLSGTLPYFIDLFEIRHEAKTDVEINRFLFEAAMFWERKQDESELKSGKVKAILNEYTDRIVIKGEDGNGSEVEILSIIWEE